MGEKGLDCWIDPDWNGQSRGGRRGVIVVEEMYVYDRDESQLFFLLLQVVCLLFFKE